MDSAFQPLKQFTWKKQTQLQEADQSGLLGLDEANSGTSSKDVTYTILFSLTLIAETRIRT